MKQDASSAGLVCPALRLGPTVWMTHCAGRPNPGVATAAPTGSPSRSVVALSSRQAASSSGPAARWIAPSTPPPPNSEELAALTTASTGRPVMSPSTISIRMQPVWH